MSRRCKEVNFVLGSADYSNMVHTSRRMSLEMIFLCLVRMYVHSTDSNVLWTMTLRRWRRASKTSPRHHQHRHAVTGLYTERMSVRRGGWWFARHHFVVSQGTRQPLTMACIRPYHSSHLKADRTPSRTVQAVDTIASLLQQ